MAAIRGVGVRRVLKRVRGYVLGGLQLDSNGTLRVFGAYRLEDLALIGKQSPKIFKRLSPGDARMILKLLGEIVYVAGYGRKARLPLPWRGIKAEDPPGGFLVSERRLVLTV